MSQKYTGGFITKSPVAPTSSAASGIWTLDQQQQAKQAGNWPAPPVFMEDLFSTYLYDGTGAAQTITNGINLSTNGGLVWIKARNPAGTHRLFDTARGVGAAIGSNSTGAQFTDTTMLSAFNTTGFSLGVDSSGGVNDSGYTFASWTFRKQPKFFDVVTYTGNGSGNRIITTSLGSPIGCVFIKRTDSTSNWATAHRKDGSAVVTGFQLNTTAAAAYPSSSNDTFDATGGFNAGYIADSSGDGVNFNGATYVAYVFAHNAGGFPVSGGGSTNGISCGTFTTVSSGYSPNVELGYEPQWIMLKRIDSTGDWLIVDTTRGWVNPSGTSADDANLRPNTTGAEATNDIGWPYATGFNAGYRGGAESTWIYVAIRRGPMKTPTVGTSVFTPVAQFTTGGYPRPVVTNFPVDFAILGDRSSSWGYNLTAQDRLRGGTRALFTSDNVPENTGALSSFASNTQFGDGWVSGSTNAIYECFQRAPSFMDVVCYTGTGVARTVTHNLTVVPELVIIKSRSNFVDWVVGNTSLGFANFLYLNRNDASGSSSNTFNNTAPTASVFSVGISSGTNEVALTYVAYLFATVADVSKVGSYTGTGALLTVNCGFTSGARFVLIKRTDSTGDWFTYDSARGITSGNDPYLLLNSTAAEVTGTNYVDTDTTGFKVTAAAPAGLNANGGTYIFLAIA